MESFLMRTHLATSIDGGLFFNLTFDPAIHAEVRDLNLR
jgi:hypothetical protein